MMGYKQPQGKLFYQFSLDERVPLNHFLREVVKTVDFSFIYSLTRPFYSHTGTPSVDPVVVFKMALLGYFYGITSERQLAEECKLNLAFMWFLGYDIDELPPDHSILSKARKRYGREVYEQFFRHVVQLCQKAGLIEGNKVFLDATLVRANASLDSLVSRELHRQLDQTPKEYLNRVWEENPLNEKDAPEDTKGVTALTGSSAQPPEDTPGQPPTNRLKRTNEKWVSRTDPDASLITRHDHRGLFLAHKVHICVDEGQARIVTAVETTPGGTAECHVLPDLIGKHTWNTRLRPNEVVADRAYGTRKVYRFLRQNGILPSIPSRKPWKKRRKLAAGFRYDRERDVYVCPKGKLLYRQNKDRPDGSQVYRVHRLACKNCENQGVLCRAKRPSIIRNHDTKLLAWVEEHLNTKIANKSLRARKQWPETVFAEMKGPRGLDQARLRGTNGVQVQALLALMAHNIRQLERAISKRSKPAQAMGIPGMIPFGNSSHKYLDLRWFDFDYKIRGLATGPQPKTEPFSVDNCETWNLGLHVNITSCGIMLNTAVAIVHLVRLPSRARAFASAARPLDCCRTAMA